MGAVFDLACLDCKDDVEGVEFSVVGYISLKHPDEAESDLVRWTEFIAEHNQHRIGLRDHHGNFTNPAAMDGSYFFGGKKP
jgi:hypothetical protein